MAGYLLDTNIVSELMHAPLGRLAQRIARAGESNVFTSVIVAAELAYGGVKKPSPRLSAALATVLFELEIKPLDSGAVDHYARLRNHLERAATAISANDMFIAAHALALDAILVTDNEGEFARVDGLRLENWLR